MEFYSHIVSEGTTLPEDLIPAFLAEIHYIVEYHYSGEYADDIRSRSSEIELDYELGIGAEEDILDDLFSLLEEITPEGFYFGTAEGDAACFGFFEI